MHQNCRVRDVGRERERQSWVGPSFGVIWTREMKSATFTNWPQILVGCLGFLVWRGSIIPGLHLQSEV
jgi:hypothetical protein